MVPRRAGNQGVLKVKVEVKGHVIQALVISRKSLLLADKWLVRHQTCTMVPRRACIQDVIKVKVKGHLIRAFCDVTKCLLYCTVSRSVSTCAPL